MNIRPLKRKYAELMEKVSEGRKQKKVPLTNGRFNVAAVEPGMIEREKEESRMHGFLLACSLALDTDFFTVEDLLCGRIAAEDLGHEDK